MRIYIPTYRRTDRQITWRQLPDKWRRKTTFVVDARDASIMKAMSFAPAKFSIVPPHVKTIAQKRAWILRTTKHERIIMMDDDLRFCFREYIDRKKGIIKLPYAGEKDARVGEAIRTLLSGLKTYPHVTLSPRQMNNQGTHKFEHGWREGARAMYVLGYHVPTVLKHCELGRIEHREDMDYTLQLLTKGIPNAMDLEHCVEQTYNSRGGASEERNVKRSNKDAVKLHEYFPKFVRVVERAYKASVPRKEVVVSWRKAYEYGKKRLERRENKVL